MPKECSSSSEHWYCRRALGEAARCSTWTRVAFLMIALIWTDHAYSTTATQTDWSEGPGLPGPVLQWGSSFDFDSGTPSYQTPGFVELGAGPPQRHTIENEFFNIWVTCPADIDLDGDQDIMGSGMGSGDISWWENMDTQGHHWMEHSIYSLASRVGSSRSGIPADLNGDGYPDALGRSSAGLVWWENPGGAGAWQQHLIDAGFSSFCHCSADIDGDGDQDVLSTQVVPGSISWWENLDGSGTSWAEHVVDAGFTNARYVIAADVDADGHLDIAAVALGYEEVTWWRNSNGVGTSWVEHPIPGTLSFMPQFLTSGDMNGDGHLDLLACCYTYSRIAWWSNENGSGLDWVQHSITPCPEGPLTLQADDIDQDGDKDIVATAYDAGSVLWWENSDGMGTSWSEHLIDGSYPTASWIQTMDADGDGEPDVVASATTPQDIAWWDLTSYIPRAYIESSILDTQCEPDWGVALWSASTPAGTSICIQVRASDDAGNMGAWSDTLTAPCSLDGVLINGDRYLQYRALLNATNNDFTPVLNEVTFTWNPLGTGEDSPPGFVLCPVVPNPSLGVLTVTFGLPEPESVSLVFFDVTGRLVLETAPSEYGQGFHSIQPGTLRPGICFVRMTAGEFTATRRFVVVE